MGRRARRVVAGADRRAVHHLLPRVDGGRGSALHALHQVCCVSASSNVNERAFCMTSVACLPLVIL